MNIPTNSRKIWMIKRTIRGLSVKDIIKLQICCGICSIAKTHPMTPAMEAIIKIAALITAEWMIMGIRSLSWIFL